MLFVYIFGFADAQVFQQKHLHIFIFIAYLHDRNQRDTLLRIFAIFLPLRIIKTSALQNNECMFWLRNLQFFLKLPIIVHISSFIYKVI